MPPAGRGRGRALVTQLAGDRDRAQTPAGVEIEDPAHDRRFHRVGHERALLVGKEVAERRPAGEPAALLGATLDPGGDAVDDGGVFELGEHGEHLQHHPAGRGAGVERLGRRTQCDLVRVEFLRELRKLAHLAREPIDAVDK